MADKLTTPLNLHHQASQYAATAPSNFSLNLTQTILHPFALAPSIQWLPVFFRTMALVVAAPILFFAALDVAAYLIARTLGAPHHHQRESHLIKVPAYAARDHLDNPAIIISPAAAASIEPSSLSSALSNLQQKRQSPSTSHPISSQSRSSVVHLHSPRYPLHFTSPSEGNFALSGEGVFSPPESRAGSPPPSEAGSIRSSRAGFKSRARAASVGVEALGSITDSTDNEEEPDTDSTTSSAAAARSLSRTLLSPSPARGATLRKRKPELRFTPVRR